MTTARPKTEKSKCRPQPPPTPIQHRTSRTRPEHVGFGASGARFRKSEKSDPARGRTWDPKCAKRAPYRLSYHGKRGSHSGAGGEGGEQQKANTAQWVHMAAVTFWPFVADQMSVRGESGVHSWVFPGAGADSEKIRSRRQQQPTQLRRTPGIFACVRFGGILGGFPGVSTFRPIRSKVPESNLGLGRYARLAFQVRGWFSVWATFARTFRPPPVGPGGQNRVFWGVRAGNLSPTKSGNRAEVGRNSSVFRDSFDGDVCFAPGKSHVQSAFLHFERWAPAFQFRGHPGGFRGSGNVTYHMGVPWGGGCVAVGGPGAVFLRDSFYGGSHPGRKRPDRRN